MKRSLSILCIMASLASPLTSKAEAPPAARSAASPKPAAGPRTAAAAKGTPSTAATAAARPSPAAKLAPPPALPVAQIVERNVAARGGLPAWRSVGSLTMAGEMDAGGKQETRLPFVLSLKRPQKSRLELKFRDQTAVQVWDGKQGWKVRPFLGRNEVEPFTAAEARSAAAAAELDGPLVDFERKGTTVELAGVEVLEGRNTYKLKLTPRGGEPLHLWIDAKTFLEARIDGEPRRIDGHLRRVTITYRDFRPEGRLQFPHTLETAVETVKGSQKMTIQSVQVGPPLDDALFAKPALAPTRLAMP